MSINYKMIQEGISIILGVIIISSLILTPRITLNTLQPCEKYDINIIYMYGNTHAWDNNRRYNELNTYRGTYTKDMVMEGTITARLCLTYEELTEIFDKAVEINFFNYPKKPIPSSDGVKSSISHMYRHILEISNGTHKNTVQWYSVGLERIDEWHNNIIDLSKFISDIVESKPEYQDLPKLTSGYA